MVKVMGSWVKLDTPARNSEFSPPPPPSLPPPEVAVGLPVRTDLSHCISLKAVVKVSYETTLRFQ